MNVCCRVGMTTCEILLLLLVNVPHSNIQQHTLTKYMTVCTWLTVFKQHDALSLLHARAVTATKKQCGTCTAANWCQDTWLENKQICISCWRSGTVN